MKKLAALAIAGASIVLPISSAIAGDYQATHLGGPSFLTWRFNSDFSGGYLCLTHDALFRMARTTYAYRYEIVDVAGETFTLRPVSGIVITNEGSYYTVEESEPMPVAELMNSPMRNSEGGWFIDNSPPENVGKACVDGGIAGLVQYVEQAYEINLPEP